MLIALCQSMCSCSCQCSTTIMKRMKQAMPFGFFVLCLPCLCDWFASHCTLCLQEWFVRVNQRMLKELLLWTLHTQGGVASHPIHPHWISPCMCCVCSSVQQSTCRKLFGLNLQCYLKWSCSLASLPGTCSAFASARMLSRGLGTKLRIARI